ncbi:hypothetical protein M0R45_004161 [Rubus argutus]|uniref:Uncharacterized protein n=1 Tax=Rubus argutus TaxID=59490 RepID=A0AAW1YJ08_RUBAR
MIKSYNRTSKVLLRGILYVDVGNAQLQSSNSRLTPRLTPLNAVSFLLIFVLFPDSVSFLPIFVVLHDALSPKLSNSQTPEHQYLLHLKPTIPNSWSPCILSLLVYYCFAIAQNYFPTNEAPKLGTAIKFSGSLSVASLVSILLPKPWDNVPYMIYVVYLVCQCGGFVRALRARGGTSHLQPVTNPTNRPMDPVIVLFGSPGLGVF